VYLLIVASIGSLGFAIWYESWIQISSIIAAVLLIGCTVISLYFKITRSEDLAFKFSSHITKGLFLLVSVICHIGLTEKALARSTCSDGLGDWVMLCFVVPFAVGITLQPDFRFILLVVVFNSAYSSVVEQNFVRNEQLNWCLSSKFNFVIYNLLIIPIYYIRERSIRYQFFSQKISEIRLDDAKREAQNANRAKRNFLSYIFHEIRVPLNAVAIGIDLLLEEKKENKVETKLDGEEDDSLPMLLKKQVESASHILDDVLSLQKIEEGRFEIEQEPFNIVHMIQTVAWTYHRICNEKHICLELDIDTTLKQKKVIGDQFRLRQVITNFISNALKFTSANGYIKITAKVIEKTEKGPVIEVSVRDNGIGISLEDQTRLFQPYVQVSAGELQKGRGTGLGLNISKHIIRLHEGKIGVKSIQNVGSKFFFHIPYRTPSKLDQKADMLSPKTSLVVSLSSKLRKNESSKAEALLSGAGLGSPPLFTPSNAISLSDSERLHDEVKLRSRRVLIVEDSATNSKLLGKMITKWNWEASFASNGKEAVSLFEQFLSHADGRADASPFDLVIMDKEMPGMNFTPIFFLSNLF
jgi:signal transduction histidine kinase